MTTKGLSIAIKFYTLVALFWGLFRVETSAQTYLQTEKSAAEIEYEDGEEWAVQKKDGYIVAASVAIMRDYGKYYKVNLFVKNLNDYNVIFDPETIKSRLFLQNRYGLDTIALYVYTSEQYLNKVQRQQNWAMVAYGVASGINAASAAYSESTSYTYGTNGTSYVTETYSYNAGAAALANIQSTNEMISLSQMMNEEVNVKKQGYLKINTLHPNEAVSGFVNVERYNKGDIFSVRIEIENTRFYFEWYVRDWKDIAWKKKHAAKIERYNCQDTDY